MRTTWFLALPVFLMIDASPAQWVSQDTPTRARLRGLSVVSLDVVWASGSGGACLRTTDGGKTWQSRPVPNTSGLDFRDIQGIDASTAYLLSSGEGEKSRIFKTIDGGASWVLQYTSKEPKGFLDAIAFWDTDHGLALGDPIGGRFTILATDDGGKHWSPISPSACRRPSKTRGPSRPAGRAWSSRTTASPGLAREGPGSPGSSAQSTAAGPGRPSRRPYALGIRPRASSRWPSTTPSMAWPSAETTRSQTNRPDAPPSTTDGGRTWTLAKDPPGYRSCVVFRDDGAKPSVIAVGPTGTSVSRDSGTSWSRLGTAGFHAVGFSGPKVVWAVGENGTMARLASE